MMTKKQNSIELWTEIDVIESVTDLLKCCTWDMQAGQNQSPSGMLVILGLWQYVWQPRSHPSHSSSSSSWSPLQQIWQYWAINTSGLLHLPESSTQIWNTFNLKAHRTPGAVDSQHSPLSWWTSPRRWTCAAAADTERADWHCAPRRELYATVSVLEPALPQPCHRQITDYSTAHRGTGFMSKYNTCK